MAKNEVRIIGGKWRGRKLKFPDAQGLRPSQDRGRETLFNWIAPWLPGAQVLDLFAGSGVLGFEALSRGAAGAELVDTARSVVAALNRSKTMLEAETATVIQADGLTYLGTSNNSQQTSRRYDLVFLDPPYQSDLLNRALERLAAGDLLAEDALVYVELSRASEPAWGDKHWAIFRDKTFGEGRAVLLERNQPTSYGKEKL